MSRAVDITQFIIPPKLEEAHRAPEPIPTPRDLSVISDEHKVIAIEMKKSGANTDSMFIFLRLQRYSPELVGEYLKSIGALYCPGGVIDLISRDDSHEPGEPHEDVEDSDAEEDVHEADIDDFSASGKGWVPNQGSGIGDEESSAALPSGALAAVSTDDSVVSLAGELRGLTLEDL